MPAALGCKASGISAGWICTCHHVTVSCMLDSPSKTPCPFPTISKSMLCKGLFHLTANPGCQAVQTLLVCRMPTLMVAEGFLIGIREQLYWLLYSCKVTAVQHMGEAV